MASSGLKLVDAETFKAIEDQLAFGTDFIDASLGGGEMMVDRLGGGDSTSLEHSEAAIRAQGATLRELQALLKARDPGFGGLVRVRNERQEFLWVHPQFEEKY